MKNPVNDNKLNFYSNYPRTTRDTSYWHGMPVMYKGMYYVNILFRHSLGNDGAKTIGFRICRNKQ